MAMKTCVSDMREPYRETVEISTIGRWNGRPTPGPVWQGYGPRSSYEWMVSTLERQKLKTGATKK